MTEDKFGELLVDLMIRALSFFRAHQTSMKAHGNNSWPEHKFYMWGCEFCLGDQVYTLQINTNMDKREPGQRDFKVLNVWLYDKRLAPWRRSYYSAPAPYMFWLQDDVGFGFDYRVHVAADRRDEISELITTVIFPGLRDLEPALILQELADL